jgi:hypothetical protein
MQMCKYASEKSHQKFRNLHLHISKLAHLHISWPRSTMDSIRVSEAPDTGSIPVEATKSVIRLYSSNYR